VVFPGDKRLIISRDAKARFSDLPEVTAIEA
jgi:hypothetical protein